MADNFFSRPVDENDSAGVGDGVAFQGEAAVIHKLVDHGLRGGGGKGFAIGQPVVQIGHQMPLDRAPMPCIGENGPRQSFAVPMDHSPNRPPDFWMWYSISSISSSRLRNMAAPLFGLARHSSLITRHCSWSSSRLMNMVAAFLWPFACHSSLITQGSRLNWSKWFLTPFRPS